MKRIFKYPIAITDVQEISMPRGAELLHVEEQAGYLCIWARVDDSEPDVKRTIFVHGTGHIVGSLPYVGTALTMGGLYVWHVFDGGELGDLEAEEMNEALSVAGYPLEV